MLCNYLGTITSNNNTQMYKRHSTQTMSFVISAIIYLALIVYVNMNQFATHQGFHYH